MQVIVSCLIPSAMLHLSTASFVDRVLRSSVNLRHVQLSIEDAKSTEPSDGLTQTACIMLPQLQSRSVGEQGFVPVA